MRPTAIREERPPTLPVVQPNLPPVVLESGRAVPVAASPLPEPTIHVTIGRLEIRSADKTRPSKEAERPVPTASLEQYLARRREDAS